MQSVIMKSSIAWTYQTESVLLVCVLVLAFVSLSTSGKQTYTHLHHMKLVNCFPFLAPTASSLTSSVEEQGRQAACPREEVTFTCMVDDGFSLEWISDAFSGAPEQFSQFDTDSEVGVSRMYDQFTANLTRLVSTPGNPGVGDITSTLVFIAAAEHNGIVIQCTDRITPLSVSLAGIYVFTLPVSYLLCNYTCECICMILTHVVITTVSAPLNPMVGGFNYYRYNFTVAVEWTYPDSDPTPDVFTVLVSTSGSTTSTQTVRGNETSVALTLLYNVDYTVGITATLCGNTSAPTMRGNVSEG